MFTFLKNIFFFVLFVILYSNNIYAITPTPTSFLNVPQPGISCGDASSLDPNIIKCCKMPINSPDLITAQFKNNAPPLFRGPLLDTIADQINKNAAIVNFSRTQVKLQPCMVGVPSTPGDTNNDSCVCIAAPTNTPLSTIKPICDRISPGTNDRISPGTNERNDCISCVDGGGYWSSLGCFSGNINEFITEKVLGTGVGIAGGIAMLCIMFAAFQMQTSSGNAEKIKKAQELLTNCITGLMIIIFSVLILKIIGVDILRIPGFN